MQNISATIYMQKSSPFIRIIHYSTLTNNCFQSNRNINKGSGMMLFVHRTGYILFAT